MISQKQQHRAQNKAESAKILKARAWAFSGDAALFSAVSSIIPLVRYPTNGAPSIEAEIYVKNEG